MSPRDLASLPTDPVLPLPAGWATIRDEETGATIYVHADGRSTLERCPACGTPFVSGPRKQTTCGEKVCRWRLREKTSKGRTEAKKARFDRWYELPSNRRRHVTTTLAARKRRDVADRIAALLAEAPRPVRALYAAGLGAPTDVEGAIVALWYVGRLRLEGDVLHPAPGHPARKNLGLPPARFAVPDVLRAPANAPATSAPRRGRRRVHPVAPPVAPAHVVPTIWERPAPVFGAWLPGLAVEIRLETLRPRGGGWVSERLSLHAARTLHAVTTRALGLPHAPEAPGFALIPTNASRSAWGLYVPDEQVLLDAIAREHRAEAFGRAARLCFGTRARLRAPTVTPGRHRIRVDVVTPLVVRTHRASGREVTHARPNPATLVSALITVARRLGLDVDPADLAVDEVEHDGEVVGLPILSIGDGEVRGWLGALVLDCNAPARWLFEVAARIGLGGRVAFGFGRIAVRDAAPEEAPEAIPRPVTARERYEELWLLLTPRQRDILAIFAEAQRAHRPRPTREGAEGPFFVTPHAVERFVERSAGPDASYGAALRACIDLGRNAERIGEGKPDPETGAPTEIWEGVTRTGQRVRFVVGTSPSPWIDARLPQMVTVLPPEEATGAGAVPDPTGLDWTILDRAARAYLEHVAPVAGVEQARRCIRLELLHATRVAVEGKEECWRGPEPRRVTYLVQVDEDGGRTVYGVR